MRALAAATILLLASCTGPAPAAAGADNVPAEAYRWQGYQTRISRQELGPNAPVPLLAAQVHQESRWRHGAESPVGARGLAQFMPGTAEHVEQLSGGLSRGDVLSSPRANLRAQAVYMAWLRDRADVRRPATPPDRWAWVLSGYNGGMGWLDKERHGDGDPRRWYCDTYRANARSKAAWRENRHYVRTIKSGQSRYQQAGWRGPTVAKGGDCGNR